MRLSTPKKLLAIALATSTFFDPVTSQIFHRCNSNQQLRLTNAWDDATMLANAAWAVLNGRTNEALVQKYFPAISVADRTMVEQAFFNVGGAATIRNTFVIACGDFLAGDYSSSGEPVGMDMAGCQNPETNAYTRTVSYPMDIFGWATNDIAACAMLNPDRIGTLQGMYTDLDKYIAFCAESDIPGLTGANIGTRRRMYFPGWTLLHEFIHTSSIGGHILSQGPTDNMPYPGAADFTYDQAEAGLLDPELAARNADSYAHFAWEAFFMQTCGKQAQSAPARFGQNDYIDWDAVLQAALAKRDAVLKAVLAKRDAVLQEELAKRTLGSAPRAALKTVPAKENDDQLATIPAIVEHSASTTSQAIVKRLTSHPLAKRAPVTPTKPRTRRRKGLARKVKIIRCKNCREVFKRPGKGKKLAAPKRVVIKKCKAKELFIPAILVSKKPNPKLKKGMCMPAPTKAATTPPGTKAPTTPGTKNPTNPGTKTPVKLPVVKQPGKTKVVMPGRKKASAKKVN